MKDAWREIERQCVVIGCGNAFAADDAAGLELVARLAGRGYAGCAFRFAGCGAVDLLSILEHAASVLLIDTVRTGARPGTIHLVPLPGSITGRNESSLGAIGIRETIDLARVLGRRIPPVVLLGIEAGATRAGTPMSPACIRAIDYCEFHFDELRMQALQKFSRSRTIALPVE